MKHIGVISTPTLDRDDPGFQSEDDRINAGQLRGASVQFLKALAGEHPRPVTGDASTRAREDLMRLLAEHQKRN